MASKITTGIKDLVDQANSEVTCLTIDEARDMHGREDVVFVDLRDPRELERDGKIPDAFSCTRGMLEFWIDPDSPYAKPVFQEDKTFVFYCASGWRSALACKTAQDMGLTTVAHVLGGFGAWKNAGNEVETVPAGS